MLIKIPNEILNLIFMYVEKNRIGILFINPIIAWKKYLRHYCEDEPMQFHCYYVSIYNTVYSTRRRFILKGE
jgi:hypothetical protein